MADRRCMDDEEDDVFEPDSHCWRTAFREIKYEDRGTQTPSPVLPLPNNMLPCGVAQEPRLLFYGTATHTMLKHTHANTVCGIDKSGALLYSALGA